MLVALSACAKNELPKPVTKLKVEAAPITGSTAPETIYYHPPDDGPVTLEDVTKDI